MRLVSALPKTAAIAAWIAAAAIVILHVYGWFLAADPGKGSDVERHLAEAGYSFTFVQRVAGFLIEGAPKAAYVAALAIAASFLWPRAPARGECALKRIAQTALLGAALLLVYPVVLSGVFSLTEPSGKRALMLSVSLSAAIAMLASLLFAAFVTRLGVRA